MKEQPSSAVKPDAIVQVDHACKSFGGNPALRDISLSIKRNSVLVLIGPSGSGKTTLLRSINHLVVLDSGFVEIDGDRIGYQQRRGRWRPASEQHLAAQRREAGMVFQHFNLFAHKTAMQNVTEGLIRVRGVAKEDANRRATELLTRVGLGDKCGSYPSELSGGQKQRVAIARSVAMEPKVLLFDEPTSALDPETVGEVLAVIEDLAATGMTMMLATHEMSFARRAADRVVMMENGAIVEDGTPDQIFEHAASARTRSFLSLL